MFSRSNEAMDVLMALTLSLDINPLFTPSEESVITSEFYEDNSKERNQINDQAPWSIFQPLALHKPLNSDQYLTRWNSFAINHKEIHLAE